jgi:flagellar assembly factor FliW
MIAIAHPEGTVEVPEDAIVQFTEPLLGFPGRQAYALIPAARDGLWWCISVEEPVVTFVLADPFVAMAEFGFDLSASDRERLDIREATDPLVLVVVQLPLGPDGVVTANLRAPIVVNLRTRDAAQLISGDERQALAAPIDLSRYPLRASEPVVR